MNSPSDKSISPDDLMKTTAKGNVELTEEELGKASGGVSGAHLKEGTITNRKAGKGQQDF